MKSRISADQPPAGTGIPPARTRGTEADSGWQLEPHCCRNCFGRIVSRKHPDGGRDYHCPNCGIEGSGQKPSVICACGMKLRKSKGDGRSSFTLVDAGLRCHLNQRQSPEFPALYVASHGGAQALPDV